MPASHLPEQSSTGEPATKLTSEKLKLSSGGNEDDHGEGTVSDTDLDDIIGISDSSALEVIQQPYVVSFRYKLACLDFSHAPFTHEGEGSTRRSAVRSTPLSEAGPSLDAAA